MIYTGLSRTGEIESVKAHGGGDIAEVYGGIGETNPIYYKSRTITGTLPLSYKALGKPLSDYLILGNTVQDGTPTPEAPVDVVGCGNLTDNLIPNTSTSNGWVLGYRNSNGTYSSDHMYGEWLYNGYIPVTPGVSVTISASYGGGRKSLSVYGWDGNKTFIQSAKMDIRDNYTNATYLVPDGVAYISLAIRTFCHSDTELVDAGWWIMLNLGSTAIPYEPYGYKLTPTVTGTEHPIYLGQCESTRRIKKLVLTGEEDMYATSDGALYFTPQDTMIKQYRLYCTHYAYYNLPRSELPVNAVTTRGGAGTSIWFKTEYATPADFKSYLASQYANGTPVTVWYVLATPVTAVVNEPLNKIGNYADTITMAQVGVTIPTTAGSNTLSVGTTVQPSEVSITGNIKKETIMPHMDGITNFYDCKKGLTTSSWENQIPGENDAVLVGATITQDGDLQVLCTSASHGYFDANISHGGAESMCLYAVYKGDICGFVNQNRHVIGSCYDSLSRYTSGGWLTAAIGGYRGDYDRLGADLWGMGCGSSVYCDSYHVVAVNKLYWQSTYNWYKVSMYIDGVLISETSDFRVPSGIKFGIGALRDANNEFGYNDRDLPIQIKMIAVGGESHSAEQIAQNSAWLRSYYGLAQKGR